MPAHACNNPLTCPACIWRFWKWAENQTQGGKKRKAAEAGVAEAGGTDFYVAAGKFIDIDRRSIR